MRRPVATMTAAVLAAALLGATPGAGASAASSVTIGEVLTGTLNVTCLGAANLVQKASRPGASSYTVPFDGVVTSYSAVQDANNNVQVRMLILGPPTGTSFPVLARTGFHTLLASSTSTFDVRVPVKAGSLLGAGYSNGHCGQVTSGTDDVAVLSGNPDTDATLAGSSLGTPARVNIAAVVEPDADHDGFGDVSQDACPESALAQSACPAPETTITKKPKAKTKKRQVTLAFASSAARSTFLVSVDGKPAKEMLSPLRTTLKPGKHTITVQAVSPLGIADATPAQVKFKIKKPKRH
jgi:hypothetical protein